MKKNVSHRLMTFSEYFQLLLDKYKCIFGDCLPQLAIL